MEKRKYKQLSITELEGCKGRTDLSPGTQGRLFLGGSGGTGVLLVKKHKGGNWSQPAFYTMGSVPFGLQIGGEAAEVIMLVTSKKAIDSLYASSVKLGGDASIALGPVGAGAESTVAADFISFTKSKGLYAGLNLEGSLLAVRDKLNQGYYGKVVSPVDIIVQDKVSNKGKSPSCGAEEGRTINSPAASGRGIEGISSCRT